MSEWYDWRHGRITVQWPIRIGEWEQAAGVVRVHDDAEKIPGDYHCVGTIIVKNRQYEVMGFMNKGVDHALSEFKAFYDYLASLELTRFRHVRIKSGGGDVS